jgi:DegV family protein with EDD domain
MNKVAIVTDSTAYIPPNLVEKHNLTVVPLNVIWGEESFRDGVDITPDEFYTRLENAREMPTTSQPSPSVFKEAFGDLLEKGHDVLAILLSSKLSATIDSAKQARSEFPDASIEIVDSYSITMSTGYQVLAVAKAAAEGASLEECKAIAEKAKDLIGIVLSVDTLEFLHRGGRIGGGSRFLGSALNIKPILEVTGGAIEAVERVRTRRKAQDRLIELVGERIGDHKPVRIACVHASAPEDAQAVLDKAKQQLGAEEALVSELSPVVGVHVGPGTIALAFMAGM